MKNFILTFASLIISFISLAQAPEKMNYQAVIRDSGGVLVGNQTIGMQLSVIQGSPTGAVVYTETQTTLSNTNGLATLEIGTGTVVIGDFATIDWAANTHYLKTETDVAGGTNYTIVSTSQLLSVPYAMYAKTSGSSTPGPQGDAGPQGEPGPSGNTTLNGTLPPTNEGNDGDFYINTTTNTIYGPKTAGNWGAGNAFSVETAADYMCSTWVIPYMPYNVNASQIIYITRGDGSAAWPFPAGGPVDSVEDITVVAVTDQGVTYNLGVITTAPSGTVIKLNTLIDTALMNAGFSGTGKLSFRISSGNNNLNFYLYAAYNAGGLRADANATCID